MIEAFWYQIINMTFKIQVRIQIYSQQSYRFWKPKTTIRKENTLNCASIFSWWGTEKNQLCFFRINFQVMKIPPQKGEKGKNECKILHKAHV